MEIVLAIGAAAFLIAGELSDIGIEMRYNTGNQPDNTVVKYAVTCRLISLIMGVLALLISVF